MAGGSTISESSDECLDMLFRISEHLSSVFVDATGLEESGTNRSAADSTGTAAVMKA